MDRPICYSFVALLLFLSGISALNCNDEELSEAKASFKNCVESAQANLLSKGDSANLDDLCNGLDVVFDTCEEVSGRLADCTSVKYVDNLKVVHLDTTAKVLKAINHNVDIQKCSVLQKQNEDGEEESENGEPEEEAASEAGAETEPISEASSLLLLSKSSTWCSLLLSTAVSFLVL